MRPHAAAAFSAAFAIGVLGLPAAVYAAPGAPAPVTPLAGGSDASAPLVRTYPDRPVTGLIVRTRDGKAPTSGVRATLARLTGGSASARGLGGGMTRLPLGRPLSMSEANAAAKTLAAQPGVLSVTPDSWVYPTAAVTPPNDPGFSSQWDLWDSSRAQGGYSVRALNGWSHTRGSSSVVVAVIDTGLTVHPDLSSSVTNPTASDANVKGYDFVGADPVASGPATFYAANDGNGWDSNPSDPGDGITVADNSGLTAGGLFQNCGGDNPDGSSYSSWHGTHVAGTIAAHQGNGIGVSGVAPGVKIQPVRVLGKCGGSDSDVVAAIEWASGGSVPGVPLNANPAKVINMSLGGPGTCQPATQTAIDHARSRGVTVVVAAGNSGGRASDSQPADCHGVIAVTASTRTGGLASYSNYGVNPGDVTLAAPGGDGHQGGDNVLSTINLGLFSPGGAGYAEYAGTSMATPHVAAAVALLQSRYAGSLTPDEVASHLTSTVAPWPAGSGCTVVRCGAGILDIGTLLAEAPNAATPFVATAADGGANLRWGTPDDNGAPLISLDLTARVQGTSTWRDVALGLDPATTSFAATEFADHTPLVNGTAYEFQITGTNRIGVGAASTVTVTPSATPPPNPPAAPVLAGQVEHLGISWTPASSGPAPTAYAVRYRKVGAASWTCATGVSLTGISGCDVVNASTTSRTVTTWPTAMTPGIYEAEVAATGTAGDSVWSDAGTATVRALVETVTTSTALLRPLPDGYEDTTPLHVTTNRPGGASGRIDIVDVSGRVVRTLELAHASGWSLSWNGRTRTGARLPTGTYFVHVHLVGRSTEATALASVPVIHLALTQATTPAVALSTTRLFPAPDGYRDRIMITTRNEVPATMTWRVVRGTHTYWSKTWARARSVTAGFTGLTTGGRLPAGTYTLLVTAKAGEGVAVSARRTFTVSSGRAVPSSFRITAPVADAVQFDLPGTSAPVSPWGSGGYSLPSASGATFAPALPASALPLTSLRVAVSSAGGTAGTPAASAGYFTGDPISPTLVTSTTLGTPITGLGLAPTSAASGGRLRFFVRNTASLASSWVVTSYTLTGIRYVLVP